MVAQTSALQDAMLYVLTELAAILVVATLVGGAIRAKSGCVRLFLPVLCGFVTLHAGVGLLSPGALLISWFGWPGYPGYGWVHVLAALSAFGLYALLDAVLRRVKAPWGYRRTVTRQCPVSQRRREEKAHDDP